MKNVIKLNKKGFTLIEMLVVVLIIGILAAIAVPKYKTAVKLSKLKTALPVLKSLAAAEQAYYLANGAYTRELTNLDITVPGATERSRNDNDGGGATIYQMPWGTFNLYNTYSAIATRITDTALLEIPYTFPASPAVCYNDNDEVCKKLPSSRYNRTSSDGSKLYVIYHF